MQKNYHSGAPRRSNRAPHKRRGGGNSRQNNKTIHHSKFINKAVEAQAEVPYGPTHTFHDFGLNKRTVATLDYLGFTSPSPIQDQCIAPALEGRDVIGLANTGTGKTAAFLLPIIERLNQNPAPMTALMEKTIIRSTTAYSCMPRWGLKNIASCRTDCLRVTLTGLSS
jgi:ATP-dependent helicase YprA (DUF1998 family)